MFVVKFLKRIVGIFKNPTRKYLNIRTKFDSFDMVINILSDYTISNDITVKQYDGVNGYSNLTKKIYLDSVDTDIVSCYIAAHEAFHVVHYEKLKSKILMYIDIFLTFINNKKVLFPLLLLSYVFGLVLFFNIVLILSIIKCSINLYTEYYANKKSCEWIKNELQDDKINKACKHLFLYEYTSYVLMFLLMVGLLLITIIYPLGYVNFESFFNLISQFYEYFYFCNP